jgi:hypothetical protein
MSPPAARLTFVKAGNGNLAEPAAWFLCTHGSCLHERVADTVRMP